MRHRGDVIAYVVAGTAFLVLACLLSFALYCLIYTETEMHHNESDNMLWIMSQTQSAVILFDAAVTRKAGIPDSRVEIDRRYNVLLSRLALLSEGPPARYIAHLGLSEEIGQVRQSVTARKGQILGVSYGDVGTAASVHAILDPFIKELGHAVTRTMAEQWEIRGARLNKQRAEIVQAIVSILAIIVLGAVLAITMLRTMAERQRIRLSLSRERETAELYRSFVALVSHQFRTPLAIIDSSMQRILRSGTVMPRTDIELRAEQIRAEIQELTGLIEATLNVIRLDAGQVTIIRRNCCIESLAGKIRSRQIEATPGHIINLRIGDEVPASIETDPFLLEQILNNLVSNAVKYSPETEPVSISITAESGQICFCVEDSGIGIPEDEQEKLFGRFFRASTSREKPGTGVGLSISRQLATLLGGEISFVSRTGIGSAFTLKLPRE